jgi:hypothetical protein
LLAFEHSVLPKRTIAVGIRVEEFSETGPASASVPPAESPTRLSGNFHNILTHPCQVSRL